MHRKDVIPTTITSASLPAKKRILTVCVKLFLEQGYKKTTVSEIVHKASVSNSIFQNIFRAKDGVPCRRRSPDQGYEEGQCQPAHRAGPV